MDQETRFSEERKLLISRPVSFNNRETSLEEENIEYTNALAKAEALVQQKNSEISRIKNEQR